MSRATTTNFAGSNNSVDKDINEKNWHVTTNAAHADQATGVVKDWTDDEESKVLRKCVNPS